MTIRKSKPENVECPECGDIVTDNVYKYQEMLYCSKTCKNNAIQENINLEQLENDRQSNYGFGNLDLDLEDL